MTTKEQRAANTEIMRQHIAFCKASGLSVQKYCKNNGLSIHRFNYYKRRKKRLAFRHTGFIRVKYPVSRAISSMPSARHPTVEVTLANGTRMAFFEPNSLDLFKALL